MASAFRDDREEDLGDDLGADERADERGRQPTAPRSGRGTEPEDQERDLGPEREEREDDDREERGVGSGGILREVWREERQGSGDQNRRDARRPHHSEDVDEAYAT